MSNFIYEWAKSGANETAKAPFLDSCEVFFALLVANIVMIDQNLFILKSWQGDTFFLIALRNLV